MTSLAEMTTIARFLIDVRQAPYRGTVTSQYNLAYEKMDEIGYRRQWRTAILTATRDESHDFLQMAAENAGYTVRLFENETAALSWLQ